MFTILILIMVVLIYFKLRRIERDIWEIDK